ncbi:MAG: hypothetical protein U0570_10055 [Phycisphaerales bacterium]
MREDYWTGGEMQTPPEMMTFSLCEGKVLCPADTNDVDPSGPLSTEHFEQLAAARKRAKKILRAAFVAALSGWSMVAFAGLTLALAIFSDWSAWAVGIGLMLAGVNELRGGALLRKVHERGASVLGWNQLFLAAVLVSYALWSLWWSFSSPSLAALQEAKTGDPQVDELVQSLGRVIGVAVYGTMAVVGLVAPGLTSIYYFSRAGHVRAFLRETPPWIVELIRRGG